MHLSLNFRGFLCYSCSFALGVLGHFFVWCFLKSSNYFLLYLVGQAACVCMYVITQVLEPMEAQSSLAKTII